MKNPFENEAARESKFWKDLKRANEREIIPIGFNLTREENPSAEFRTLEMLEVGAKANREERICNLTSRDLASPRSSMDPGS